MTGAAFGYRDLHSSVTLGPTTQTWISVLLTAKVGFNGWEVWVDLCPPRSPETNVQGCRGYLTALTSTIHNTSRHPKRHSILNIATLWPEPPSRHRKYELTVPSSSSHHSRRANHAAEQTATAKDTQHAAQVVSQARHPRIRAVSRISTPFPSVAIAQTTHDAPAPSTGSTATNKSPRSSACPPNCATKSTSSSSTSARSTSASKSGNTAPGRAATASATTRPSSAASAAASSARTRTRGGK